MSFCSFKKKEVYISSILFEEKRKKKKREKAEKKEQRVRRLFLGIVEHQEDVVEILVDVLVVAGEQTSSSPDPSADAGGPSPRP